jgi:predicted Holliday junction resolvase-like endonuclease
MYLAKISTKILILVAVIALAYIFRDVPLYWITVKALQEQKKQQQQDDRQNRDRRDRFNENREHRNYYEQKYREHEQKYNQLVKQKIETLPRLVIVST